MPSRKTATQWPVTRQANLGRTDQRYPTNYDKTTGRAVTAEMLRGLARGLRTVTANTATLPDWLEANFWIPGQIDGGLPRLVTVYPHQRAVLLLGFTRDDKGRFGQRIFIYSTVKQSGKSAIAGGIGRWYAETQGNRQEVYAIGNDRDQAKDRSFREIRYSLELSPGYDYGRDALPGRWTLLQTSMRCVTTGSIIRALAVDAKGEAGGKPALQIWTELWGFENEKALRFWDELTPIPTVPDSMRIVETYAGYSGESKLLQDQYDLGKAGKQLTAGELARRTGTPIGSFLEAQHPDSPVPVYENVEAGLLMYWDEGLSARRMPWQCNDLGQEYYRQQELTLLPAAFNRLHLNLWTSAQSSYIPIEVWDARFDRDIPPLIPGDPTPIVLAVDAASSNDCFAIVAISRHPVRHDEVAVRAVKSYKPSDWPSGRINYDDCERDIRMLCEGGCVRGHPVSWQRDLKFGTAEGAEPCSDCVRNGTEVPKHNVVHIAYDPYQLEQMMMRLLHERVAWTEAFPQGADRLRADKGLYDMVVGGRLWHAPGEDGKPLDVLRQHVLNARAKLQAEQDSTLRIVKTSDSRKIDCVVATSMGAARCMSLRL